MWDNSCVWLVAHPLRTVLAAVLEVHPDINQTSFLAAAQLGEDGEDRLDAELTKATQARTPKQP
jgi:hypothetical protein